MLSLLTLFGHFVHFQLSERYEIYETLIEKWSFWLKWGVYQVIMTNGSREIYFWPFWSLFMPFWPLVVPYDPIWAFLEQVRLSEMYEIYEKLIEIWSFWLKWGVYQVSTTNGLREIDFWPFWSFFMPFWPHVVPFDPIGAFLSTSGYLKCMKYMKH